MQLINDEIDGNFYIELVLSPNELNRMKRQEMLCGEMIIKRRKYYVSVRLQGIWDDELEEECSPYDDDQDEE